MGQPRSSRFQRGFPALQPRPITAGTRRVALADAIIAYVPLASIFLKFFKMRNAQRNASQVSI